MSYCKSTLEELEKLLTNGFEFLEQICQDTPAYTGEGRTMARLLLDFFQHDPKKMLYVVLWATTREIENTKSEDIVFRESNVQTELMFGYFYAKRGRKYLVTLLSPLITSLQKQAQTVQVQDLRDEELRKYLEGTIEHIQAFVDRFVNLDAVPSEFQRVFRHMKKEMNNRFPTSEHQFIVLSLLFLRIICPALVKPSLLSNKIEASNPEKPSPMITPSAQKAFVYCARVLQNLANFCLFDDPVLACYNQFLLDNRERVKEFFLRLTMESASESRSLKDVSSPPPSKKKAASDKSTALWSILSQLNPVCKEKLGKTSRLTMANNETREFMTLLNHPKWKLYKRRSDAETFVRKNRENSYTACKLSATIRASVKKVFDYLRHNERCLSLWPNYLSSKTVKEHDDNHKDIVAQFKGGFPFYGLREYHIGRYDHVADDHQMAMIVAFTLEKVDSADENHKQAHFKTSGILLQRMDDNPGMCWLHLIVSFDTKCYGLFDNPSDLDSIEYSFLEILRRECEDSV